MSIPESIKINITCPGCGKESEQSLRRLHDDRHFRCPGCGNDVRIEGDGLAKIDAAFRKLADELAKLRINIRI